MYVVRAPAAELVDADAAADADPDVADADLLAEEEAEAEVAAMVIDDVEFMVIVMDEEELPAAVTARLPDHQRPNQLIWLTISDG